MPSEDVRENPGTLGLTASWILIFALMALVQWRNPVPVAPGSMYDPLPISTLTSHRFGDMTWLEVRHGGPWRLVTATFVHFGLVHLVLNGLALINLGRLVEPWYRTGPFLAVCLAIGGLGNLLGGALRQSMALARPWLASTAATHHWPGVVERFLRGEAVGGVPVSIHTGGGSTILLGLLTLAAVVGWRSRTRIGSHLQKQMIILLALTAALGLAMSNLVDNYGHLGGAILGLIIGLFDRPLFHLSEHKSFRVLCSAFAAVVAGGCFVSAAWHDRVEARYLRLRDEITSRENLADGTRNELIRLYGLYVRQADRSPYFREASHEFDALAVVKLLESGPTLTLPSKPAPDQVARDRAELEEILGRLGRTPSHFWGESIDADLASLRELGRSTLEDPPDYRQFYDFLVAWRPAFKAISADLARWKARHIELDRNPDRR